MKEQCWGCKKLKTSVQLRASDDRLCQECFLANETALANIRRDEQIKANVTTQSKAAAAATATVTSASATDTHTPITIPSSVAATASRNPLNTENRVIVNELLSYVCFFRDRGNTAALHRIVTDFLHATRNFCRQEMFDRRLSSSCHRLSVCHREA